MENEKYKLEEKIVKRSRLKKKKNRVKRKRVNVYGCRCLSVHLFSCVTPACILLTENEARRGEEPRRLSWCIIRGQEEAGV